MSTTAVRTRRTEAPVRLLRTQPRKRPADDAQCVALNASTETHWLVLPSPLSEVLPGVKWGYIDECYSAAFWGALAWQGRFSLQADRRHALGRDLREEIAACLLGGHGMPAEVGLAAFAFVRSSGLLSHAPYDAREFEAALRTPLHVGDRRARYRFPVVKARQLALTLTAIERAVAPKDSIALRNWLRALPGIGPKTASWIVRNRDAGARVAILDIHVIRACQILGLFPGTCRLPRDYDRLEADFLRLSDALHVPPGDLDAVMWYEMRLAPVLVERALTRARAAIESLSTL